MKFCGFTVLLALGALPVAAGPEKTPGGGVLVTSDRGTLTRTEAWWSPAPGWEGRFWTGEGTGGAAWVRLGPLQAGPLVGSSGPEGLRKWSRGTDLSSGHWGMALDLDQGGLWAVQGPGSFEAGGQVRVAEGPWTLASGFDRTWTLTEDLSGAPRWSDRARAGGTWEGEGASWGVEASARAEEGGAPGFSGKARGTWETGPWSAQGRAAAGWPGDPGWSAEVGGGWGPWTVGWRGSRNDAAGQGLVGWGRSGVEVSGAWGPAAGADFGALGRLPAGGTDLEAGGRVSRSGDGWTGRVNLGAHGRWDRGRWAFSWALGPGDQEPLQTLTASWREPTFGAEARWKVPGLRLGWMGPGTALTTTVSWWF